MKVLLMPISDYVRYKYMKEALLESNEIQLSVGVRAKSERIIDKIISWAICTVLILKTEVVIFSNDMNLWLYKLALLFNKRIIVDMYVSVYQTNILSKKIYPIESSKAKSILSKEQFIVRNSSKLIFLNESERDYYLSVIGVTPKNTCILPLFNTEKSKANLDFWTNKTSTFNICWWGGENNPIHGLNNISDALDVLYSKNIKFNFFIFGTNQDKGEIYYQGIFSSKKWSDKVFVYYNYTLKNNKLEYFLRRNCSVALGPLSDEIKAKVVITNKALDAISMEIPLLTIESRGMREYFDDSMVYYCENASADTIANKLIQVINSEKSDIDSHVKKAKKIFINFFNIQTLKKDFVDIVRY